jgi:hypothetical protein
VVGLNVHLEVLVCLSTVLLHLLLMHGLQMWFPTLVLIPVSPVSPKEGLLLSDGQ